jgi:hypothetical protein
MPIDWGLLARDGDYDRRGARLEWKIIQVRMHNGDREDAIAMRCPTWIESQIRPEMTACDMQEVSLKSGNWDIGFLVSPGAPDDDLEAFLSLLSDVCSLSGFGGVDLCLALDLYKIPDDDKPSNQWANTEAGELVSRSKYWGPPAGPAAFRRLTGELATVVSNHPLLRSAECIVSIPGRSSGTYGHGERLARAVAETTGITFFRTQGLYGERPQAKAGEFKLTEELVAVPAQFGGSSVIIVDDVLMSGSSMAAVAGKVRDAGGGSVYGLVGAKTLKNH